MCCNITVINNEGNFVITLFVFILFYYHFGGWSSLGPNDVLIRSKLTVLQKTCTRGKWRLRTHQCSLRLLHPSHSRSPGVAPLDFNNHMTFSLQSTRQVNSVKHSIGVNTKWKRWKLLISLTFQDWRRPFWAVKSGYWRDKCPPDTMTLRGLPVDDGRTTNVLWWCCVPWN